MDGETEDRQDVDVVEEQTDDTLSSDEIDITQPWQPTPTLEAAAANRSGPGLRRDQSLELASDPPQGTEFSVCDRPTNALSDRPAHALSDPPVNAKAQNFRKSDLRVRHLGVLCHRNVRRAHRKKQNFRLSDDHQEGMQFYSQSLKKEQETRRPMQNR